MISAFTRMTLAASVAAIVSLSGSALAQDAEKYPVKPIRFVVGFSAGGPTDIPARFIADQLSKRLGERVLVDNRTGAGGMIATREVLAQPRDGYTLLLCTHFESINTAVYRNPGFKLEDIEPISLTSRYYYGIALANNVEADDFDSFLAYAKANPGKISYATIGTGSAQDIFGRQIEDLADIEMTAVPYRGGALVLPDIFAGRVQLYVAPTANVLPNREDKKLKVVAITSPERLEAVPDIPTLKEKGLDFVRFGWLGICAAKGTPQPILDTLNKHIREIIAMPEYQALIKKTGAIPESSTPADLQTIIDQTLEEVAETVKQYKLQRD